MTELEHHMKTDFQKGKYRLQPYNKTCQSYPGGLRLGA